MKRGKSYEWIPLWVEKWLWGSTRLELNPAERSVWIDLMALASKDDGYIRANPTTAYLDQQIAGMLCIKLELLRSTIEKCIKYEKLKKDETGVLYIINWEEYSLTGRHKRRLMSENPDIHDQEKGHDVLIGGPASKSKSMSKSKSLRGKSAGRGGIRLILDNSPKRWEGITEEDKALWAKTYPGCDVERVLQEMIAYWDAQPKSALKLNWKRTIVNRLKWLQDRGGSGSGRGNREPDHPQVGASIQSGHDIFREQYEKNKAKEARP